MVNGSEKTIEFEFLPFKVLNRKISSFSKYISSTYYISTIDRYSNEQNNHDLTIEQICIIKPELNLNLFYISAFSENRGIHLVICTCQKANLPRNS